MRRLIVLSALALIGSIWIATVSSAGSSKSVEGDVLKIEGEFYTVHDTAGHEVRLHVDKSSKLTGTFKTGDKVEARVTEKGHVLSMKHAPAISGGMASLGPQTIKGDVLKIDGEFYTVHDTEGHEVRLHVDKSSKLSGTFKTGDKVEAQVTDKGHVLSMKHARAAR